MAKRSRRALFVASAVVVVAMVALGLAAWSFVGAASAHPGNTCDPEPGHGTPGCHVGTSTSGTTSGTTPGSSSTTAGSSSTTGATTSTTAAATSSPPATSVVPYSGPEAPIPNAVSMFADQNNCLSCHGDPALKGLLTKRRSDGSSIALYVDTVGSTNSVHRYKDCTACHTAQPHQVNSPLTKLSLSEKCGSCHEYEYSQYKQSVHGRLQAGGNEDPATCTDCHSTTSNPHNVVRVLDPSASTYPKNIADTCAKCHNDSKLMDKYGVVEKVYATYMRSFHGKTMKLAPESSPLQSLDTATCVNCHGAHNITSAYDPNAPTAGMDNLLETCRSCHPSAGPEFVKGFLGHKAANSDYLPQVYWGGRAFYIFSRGMLVFGALVVATSISLRGVPWITRRVRRKKKEEE